MNVEIGTLDLHDVDMSSSKNELQISYMLSDDKPSFDDTVDFFSTPCPCVHLYDGESSDDGSYYYGYIESNVSLQDNIVKITLTKPSVDVQLEYMYRTLEELRSYMREPMFIANTMIQENITFMSNLVDSVIRN